VGEVEELKSHQRNWAAAETQTKISPRRRGDTEKTGDGPSLKPTAILDVYPTRTSEETVNDR
jgi:hypothetical protein